MFGWSCLCVTSCFVLSLRCSLTSGSILVHPSAWSRIEAWFIIHRSHTSHTSHFAIYLLLHISWFGSEPAWLAAAWPAPDFLFNSTKTSRYSTKPILNAWVFFEPSGKSTQKIRQTERLGKNQGSHVLGLCQLCDLVISSRYYGFNLMQTYAKQITPWELRFCEVSIYLDAPVVAERENMSRRRDGGYGTSNPM